MTNPTIDINTTAGQVAGQLILSKDGLFKLIVAAFGGIADCDGYVYSTEPTKPLKGRGHIRHTFDVESESAKRFYDALPSNHKDSISSRNNSNYKRYTWEMIISDEAKRIWDIYHRSF